MVQSKGLSHDQGVWQEEECHDAAERRAVSARERRAILHDFGGVVF